MQIKIILNKSKFVKVLSIVIKYIPKPKIYGQNINIIPSKDN